MAEIVNGPKIVHWMPGRSAEHPTRTIHAASENYSLARQLTEAYRLVLKDVPWMAYYERPDYCMGVIAPFVVSDVTTHGQLAQLRTLWLDSRYTLSECDPQGLQEYHARRTRIAILRGRPDEYLKVIESRELFEDPLQSPFSGLVGIDDRIGGVQAVKLFEYNPREELIFENRHDVNYNLARIVRLRKRLSRVAHTRFIL